MSVLVIANLTLTILLLSILHITENGMTAFQFDYDFISVKQNFVGEGTCELNDALYSNPGNNLEIELTGNESFELLTFYENSGSKGTI